MPAKIASIREVLAQYGRKVKELKARELAALQRTKAAEDLATVATLELEAYKRNFEDKDAQLQTEIDSLDSELQNLIAQIEESD
jgi:uncharacterized protein YlxW (UPF0749 family)